MTRSSVLTVRVRGLTWTQVRNMACLILSTQPGAHSQGICGQEYVQKAWEPETPHLGSEGSELGDIDLRKSSELPRVGIHGEQR